MAGRRRGGRVLVPGEAQARGGLILPGEGSRRGVPTLLVPSGYESGPVVLVGKCHMCDATFYKGEEDEWQRHVNPKGACARKHLPAILAAREERKRRLAIFDEESWDPEWRDHQRKVGERMIREGRLVPRPNER